jgi:hypothetical protein
MSIGTKVLWCGFDPATVIDIAGEWVTIRFDDTHSITITNIKHLEGLNMITIADKIFILKA